MAKDVGLLRHDSVDSLLVDFCGRAAAFYESWPASSGNVFCLVDHILNEGNVGIITKVVDWLYSKLAVETQSRAANGEGF